MGSDLLLGRSAPRLPARRGAVMVLAVTALVLAALVMAKPAQAATFTVNSTADKTDANTGDSACNTGGTVGGQPECTLRAAIQQANASSGNTINVPAGTYKLTIPRRGEDAAATGDLDVTSSELTITGAGARDTTIDGNQIDRVFHVLANAKLTISGVKITGGNVNFVSNNDRLGGGILNSGMLDLRSSSVSGNTTDQSVGGIESSDGSGSNPATGSLTITDSTVSNNSAPANVEGIHQVGGTGKIVNSTISGNQAVGCCGGVTAESNATLSILNSTLASNTASSAGSGLSSLSGSTVDIQNSIVALSGGGPDCSVFRGTITSKGNNIDSDGSCGFTSSGDKPNVADPKLGSLANNGGPTDTQALQSGSPAIDAGDNAACPATDQRGVTRPQDGDNNGSALCDIGAFELAAAPPTPSPSPPPPPHHHKHHHGHNNKHHRHKHHGGGSGGGGGGIIQ